jgi:thiamine biosynthesis lipoprotein
MHRFQHTAMATQFEIRCTFPDADLARHAARIGFEGVDRLEQQLSRFVENSDISRINHLSAGESTIVSYETMQCLQLANLMHEETGGAFDASIGTGFENFELIPEAFVVAVRPPSPSRLRRDLEPASPSEDRPATDGVRLDLGAIGKGYAVDRLADVLEDWEISQALVDSGQSSVLALEPPFGEEGWPLTLSEPGKTGTVLVRIGARQRALGASGLQKVDHIWSNLERAPVRFRRAAWVSAPRRVLADISRQAGIEDSPAAVADALSTAFMISRVEDIERYCWRHPGLEAWILEGELRHFPTPEIQQLVSTPL